MNDLEKAKSLWSEGRLKQAVPVLESALGTAHLCAEAHFYLGRILFYMRSIKGSLEHHLEALRLGMDFEPGSAERWMCWMLLGRFEAAWRESDRILECRRGFRDPEETFIQNHSLWDGTSPDGKDVVVRCYHGLGDTIQFMRYLPLLKRRCGSLTFEVQPEILPLFQDSREMDLPVSWDDGAPRPRFDVEIECMELPYVFRSTLSTLPREVPYIHVHPTLTEPGRKLLDGDPSLKIALVWAGGSRNRSRDIPVSFLQPLISVPGTRFFSLQEGRPAAQGISRLGLIDTRPLFNGILGACSVIHAMDLVITVDTMAAHLAGAMGKPVWLLLTHHADWRWMMSREDSPWYPTMRLFRQPKPGDWQTPLGRMRRMLMERVNRCRK